MPPLYAHQCPLREREKKKDDFMSVVGNSAFMITPVVLPFLSIGNWVDTG